MNTKPQLRDYSLNLVIDAYLREAGNNGIQKSCLSCKHFAEQKGEVCLKFNQRPPARVLVLSCQHYEDDNDIPF